MQERNESRMKARTDGKYTALYDIPYLDWTRHRKCCTDLFLPSNNTWQQTGGNGQDKVDRGPPLVLFVHGGGWRRGDRAAWRHFVGLDINLLAAFYYRIFNLYENVGVAMARRGMACAVMSYPLTTLQSPWIVFEMLVSYLSSVTFFGIVFGFLIMCGFLLGSVLPFGLMVFDIFHVLPISLRFGSDTLLLHLVMTNLCILALITLQCRNYSLKLGQVISLWVVVFFSSMTFNLNFISLRISLLLFYSVTFVLSQGILVTRILQQESQTPRDQTKALVTCLKMLRNMGRDTGRFNPDLVFLMGHSAGGHLCSLAAIDENITGQVGINRSCIKGVVVISGVLHVERLDKGAIGPLYLHPTFGNDLQGWRDLCPLHTLKSQPSSLPDFLIVTAEKDFHLQEDAKNFCEELQTRGAKVDMLTVKATGHLRIVCYFDRTIGGMNLANKCAEFIWNNC